AGPSGAGLEARGPILPEPRSELVERRRRDAELGAHIDDRDPGHLTGEDRREPGLHGNHLSGHAPPWGPAGQVSGMSRQTAVRELMAVGTTVDVANHGEFARAGREGSASPE